MIRRPRLIIGNLSRRAVGLWLALVVGVIAAAPQPVLAASALLTEVPITTDRAALARSRPFTLTRDSQRWTVPSSAVNLWFTTAGSGDALRLKLKPAAIYDYLNVHISPQVNDLGQASRFAVVGGNLHLVSPGRKGQIVDGVKTSLAIRQALVSGLSSAPVRMQEYRPAIFSAADFQKLKFPDVLARGESDFAGSPANRRHNISVATARYNGLVLMAGEQFSFNQYLGEVDATNGYKPELVIKEHVTTPEYGGGICQVSTTAFRAALIAGFRIDARRNHSYPVAYYGTPGFDATVYAPAPDLKFTNDTGHPALIKTSIVGTKVIFEVWGTATGRQVTVNGPFVTERRPDGSVTAAVAQIVTQNGRSLREQNFVSHYQSPDKFPTIRAANGE